MLTKSDNTLNFGKVPTKAMVFILEASYISGIQKCRGNIDNLKNSDNKIKEVIKTETLESKLISFIFPILIPPVK